MYTISLWKLFWQLWLKPNRVKIMLNLIVTNQILNVIIVITKVMINLSCRKIYLLLKVRHQACFHVTVKVVIYACGKFTLITWYHEIRVIYPSAYGKKNQNFSVLNQASANLIPNRFVWLWKTRTLPPA